MKRVYKYKVSISDPTIIEDNIERLLCVEYQNTSGRVCVWAIVDDDIEKGTFVITPYGTYHKMPKDPGKYIGTVQLYSGEVVLHFFYKMFRNKEDQNEKCFDEYEMEM